jgi:catechol 2,3-dioxygenase-like lactoylglutathione lyase family enzyme
MKLWTPRSASLNCCMVRRGRSPPPPATSGSEPALARSALLETAVTRPPFLIRRLALREHYRPSGLGEATPWCRRVCRDSVLAARLRGDTLSEMAATAKSGSAALDFNHAMIYSRDVSRSLGFYRDVLGLPLLEEFRAGDRLVYARLKLPSGTATIALHLVGPGETLHTGGVRLYFEVRALERFCRQLEAKGAKFTKPPATMPWGWKHAYLDDPDGHEISLYWAGSKRLKKTKPPARKT